MCFDIQSACASTKSIPCFALLLSLLLGSNSGAHTVPYIDVRNASSTVEHEATTSRISDDQLFYCRQRGLGTEDAISLIVNGFCR